MLALAAVISTLHLTGDVPVDGGDYLLVPFEVPAGTVELEVAHDDGSPSQILDWGVWGPDGFRGWGGGLTDAAVIGVDESSRGYLDGPITPGTWTVVIGKAQLGGQAGHYTIDVELRDAATLAPGPRAAWAPVVLSHERRWYAGDFHVHSLESGDARAMLDQIVDLARQRGLDFVEISDHNTSAQIPRIAARQQGLADLLLLRGAEITTYRGHLNGIGIGAYVDHRVGLDGVGGATIADAVAAQGGALAVNHPALDVGEACIGCALHLDDLPWTKVAAVEIQTGNTELTDAIFTPRAIALWDQALDAGDRIAAIGGSDDHRAGTDTGPGAARIGSPTTMVLADELSEAAIVAAVEAGRTVVKLHGPDDPMVELTAVDADHPTRTAGIGDELDGATRVELVAAVSGAGAEGANAELWEDGALVATAPVQGGQVRFAPRAPGSSERYRVELYVDGARATVTSHVYVQGAVVACADGSGPCGGAGCCQTGGDARGELAGFLLGALALRRRRRV
ncbi:MAG TPA: CehA/McbA family metallohydrolase [Kofleriaceae bacterium]|nr:CehA/McbA family metallohydrolase [Kofleriaceae bacterium]